VYYSQLDEKSLSGYKIENVTVDVVYGKITPASCSAKVPLTRKTSWQFKQSFYSRKNSGGPGYIKGLKILTGTEVKLSNSSYI
jgi:hypothetical protein